jgi:2-octaprenyl-6-methoxyphenol hydroxylase
LNAVKILVIGAGPVGATFALLAAKSGLHVTMLEAREGPSREARTLALSHGSRNVLAHAGVWNETLRATEIHTIHTSQKGGFGRTEISREDGGVPALGYVLTYADLQTALDAQLIAANVSVERGAIVSAIDNSDRGDKDDKGATVTYTKNGAEIHVDADVVVMADGGANLSKVPTITITEKDYGQSALLGHIETDTPHQHRAFERFTADGPAALLPKHGANEFSLVWVANPEKIESLKALDDAAFCAAFQEHFGYRAGKFLSVSQRRSYPLKLRTVSSPVADRVAVIGNAAQALHPVAGQGFNLGLRDAAALVKSLASISETSLALGDYVNSRLRDVERSVGFTDFLVSAFSNDHALAKIPRGLGLAVTDMLPFARKALAKRMLFGARH